MYSFSNIPEYSNKSASVVIGKYRFIDQYSKDKNGDIIDKKTLDFGAKISY